MKKILAIQSRLELKVQPAILELSLVDEGELQNHLNQHFLAALESFRKA